MGDLGNMVRAALDPFGVDVHVDIETPGGEKKCVNKKKSCGAKAKAPEKTAEKTPDSAEKPAEPTEKVPEEATDVTERVVEKPTEVTEKVTSVGFSTTLSVTSVASSGTFSAVFSGALALAPQDFFLFTHFFSPPGV